MKYKLRLKYEKKNAYREAIVLAPGAFVAALWYKEYCMSSMLPVVVEKNEERYHYQNKAYSRAMKWQTEEDRKKRKLSIQDVDTEFGLLLDANDKKLSAAQKAYLREKVAAEEMRSRKMFHLCELVEEKAYVEIQ